MKPNCIQYAIQYVKRDIPKEIFNFAFRGTEEIIDKYTTLDDKIRNKVVEPILKMDLNCTGGVNINIPLSSCSIKKDMSYFIITVPKILTNYKSIIAVMNIMQQFTPSSINTGMFTRSSNAMTQLATKALNSVDTPKIITTSRLEIIGDNIILVQNPSNLLTTGIMNCDVENNSNLENIQPRYFPFIGKLLLNACKQYIYTNNIVSLDVGAAYGGHDISTIKEIISDYRDAGEEYDRMISEEWPKISLLNDPNRLNKLTRLIVGSNT